MNLHVARLRSVVGADSLTARMSVLDGVTRPVFVMAANGSRGLSMVFVNAALCEAAGQTRNALMEAGPSAWMSADACRRVLDAAQETLQTGEPGGLQLDSQGTRAECRRLTIGRRAVCMVTQVSRLAAEVLDGVHAELEHRAELLSTALELESMVAWTWTRSDDRVRTEYLSSEGDTPQLDIDSQAGFFDRVHPEDRGRVGETIARALATDGITRFEFRVREDEGRERWYACAARPFYDDEERPAGLVGATRDVTNRKLAYRHLAENEERLRQILEHVPECVKVVDADGRLRLMNPAGLAMLGAEDGEQVYGRRVIDLIAPEYRASYQDYHQRVIAGDGGMLEFEIVAFDGSRRWVESHAEPLRDHQGDVTAVLAVTRDVTDRRQLAEAIIDAANQEQERIGRDLHDGLGQELTGISLMLKGLEGRARQSSPELGQDVGEILELVRRALRSTRRLAHGLAPVALERGGLAEALRALVESVRSSSGIPVRLTLRVDDDIAGLETPVALQLYRIAQEAMQNALRHAEPTLIFVSLDLRDGRVRLRVTDDGKGLPEGDSYTAGLGLRTMEYRAQIIGATLRVERRTKGGTSVAVVRAAVGRSET